MEPGEELKRLEQPVLQHDPALDLAVEPPPTPASGTRTPDRSLLVAPHNLDGLETLLGVAVPLAGSSPARELIVAGIVDSSELAAATGTLAERREVLLSAGVSTRTAAVLVLPPGRGVVRLASRRASSCCSPAPGSSPPTGEDRIVLEHAPCDVAILVEAGGSLRAGTVVMPFGAGWHDWAALELGAWVARATDSPLRLIGAASDGGTNGRDASRLLADASLIVQRTAGVVAEPLLTKAGHRGISAGAEGAGLLVVGLSERWRQEGLGRVRRQLVESLWRRRS